MCLLRRRTSKPWVWMKKNWLCTKFWRTFSLKLIPYSLITCFRSLDKSTCYMQIRFPFDLNLQWSKSFGLIEGTYNWRAKKLAFSLCKKKTQAVHKVKLKVALNEKISTLTWGFFLHKHSKLWSISLGQEVERKPLISEECDRAANTNYLT